MEVNKTIKEAAESATHNALSITGSMAIYALQIGGALGEVALNRFGRPGRDAASDAANRFSYPDIFDETGLTSPSAKALQASQRLRDNLPTGD